MDLRRQISQVKSDTHYFHAQEEENFMDSERARRFVWEKDMFDDLIDLPFEQTTIPCPKRWHEALTQQYGDYMTPPPPEQQIGGHECYYVDLHHVKTTDEVLKEMGDNDELDDVITFKDCWNTFISRLKH